MIKKVYKLVEILAEKRYPTEEFIKSLKAGCSYEINRNNTNQDVEVLKVFENLEEAKTEIGKMETTVRIDYPWVFITEYAIEEWEQYFDEDGELDYEEGGDIWEFSKMPQIDIDEE